MSILLFIFLLVIPSSTKSSATKPEPLTAAQDLVLFHQTLDKHRPLSATDFSEPTPTEHSRVRRPSVAELTALSLRSPKTAPQQNSTLSPQTGPLSDTFIARSLPSPQTAIQEDQTCHTPVPPLPAVDYFFTIEDIQPPIPPSNPFNFDEISKLALEIAKTCYLKYQSPEDFRRLFENTTEERRLTKYTSIIKKSRTHDLRTYFNALSIEKLHKMNDPLINLLLLQMIDSDLNYLVLLNNLNQNNIQALSKYVDPQKLGHLDWPTLREIYINKLGIPVDRYNLSDKQQNNHVDLVIKYEMITRMVYSFGLPVAKKSPLK